MTHAELKRLRETLAACSEWTEKCRALRDIGAQLPRGKRIKQHLDMDYATARRYIRVGECLREHGDDPDGFSFSQWAELAAITGTKTREDFIAAGPDLRNLSVRDLRERVRNFVESPRQRATQGQLDPLDMLVETMKRRIAIEHGESAVQLAPILRRVRRSSRKFEVVSCLSLPAPGKRRANTEDGQVQPAPVVLATAAGVLHELLLARSAWWQRSHGEDPPSTQPQLSHGPGLFHRLTPPQDLAEIPAGQLDIRWHCSGQSAVVSKSGRDLLEIGVERVARSRVIKKDGNTKTQDVAGIVKTIAEGCLRYLTGYPKCDQSCFTLSDGTGGCYANEASHHAKRADHEAGRPYDVCFNGWGVADAARGNWLEACDMHLRVPVSPPDLGRAPGLWRVDSESADGSMSIALGIFQMWAEANPQHRLFTICSHHFRVSPTMLCWTAALPNVWVGHTVSAWFSSEELDDRFLSISEFLRHGIPSVVWVVSHPSWAGNDEIGKRALDLVGDSRLVIEAPCRLGGSKGQLLPLLGINPLGACADRREHQGQWAKVSHQAPNAPAELIMEATDNRADPAKMHSKCVGCPIRCGYYPLKSIYPHLALGTLDG